MFQQITQRSIVRVLVAGFALVILLLLAAGSIAVRNAGSIKEAAGNLVDEQLMATRPVDEIQREQATLSAVLYNLERGADPEERDVILSQLDAAGEHIDRIMASIPAEGDTALWYETQLPQRRRTGASCHEGRTYRLIGWYLNNQLAERAVL